MVNKPIYTGESWFELSGVAKGLHITSDKLFNELKL